MKLNKKLIAVLLTVVILLSLSMVVYAAHPFKDVNENAWCNEAVDFVYSKGLMGGVSEDSFAPNRTMTRGMLVTVLYRLEQEPKVIVANPFRDVQESVYYYDAICWAYENGIVQGTSDTTFTPNGQLTRQQMVTIFHRYAENYKHLDVSDAANLSKYEDASVVKPYARDAFSWAVEVGVINGTSETRLSPAGTATRAQCAAILQRFIRWTESNAPVPTTTPVVTPEVTPTAAPTAEPTATPAATPTVVPTVKPTIAPAVTPTTVPTLTPVPTVVPTVAPTIKPVITPTVVPTINPTPTITPDGNPQPPYDGDWREDTTKEDEL